MIYLDTNYLIDGLREGSQANHDLTSWLQAGTEVTISSIVWFEFCCGPLSQIDQEQARIVFPQPEPFLAEDGEMAAFLFNATGRRRQLFRDCLIAATVIRANGRLATDNRDDFELFVPHGLKLID